jgi:cyclic dehypoxanthinyl futalosine synthase
MGISREQALDCFRSDDLVGMGMEADKVRRRLHPEGVVGYVVEGLVDLSRANEGPTTQPVDEVCSKVEQLVSLGATSIRLAGSGDVLSIETALRAVRKRNPDLWITALSAAELQGHAAQTGLSLRNLLAKLMDAGLNTIADKGFTQARDSDSKRERDAWLEVHSTAHGLGMHTAAGMIFGAGDDTEQPLDLLDAIRNLQQATGGFAAFAPIAAAAPNGRDLDGVTAVERLKTLAIARMYLDTIDTIQASAAPEGLKVLQMGLRFGANDVGPVAPEGRREEEVRQIIRDAGFRPAQREMGYGAILVG